ncbi:MAG: winged helix-turn-helix transcriptional regulator [Thermoplasmata archaeon]|nr:winged helix-turn-helix transcriptional regulator [Thermoplasmata archaeon]
MSKIREILSIISKEGITNLQDLSRKVDLSISTLHALIETMIHQGYLKEVECKGNCGICRINCNSKIKMYMLTEKSMRCVEG